MENFEGGLSHTSDEVHSFDFDYWVEEAFPKLLETFEIDLSYSTDEVHSFDFDFGFEEFFLNYWKQSKDTYHILLMKYIRLISIFELKNSF